MPGTELRESDAKGRVTLPKGFASATLLFERVGDNELRVRKAKVTPLDEAEAPLATLQPLSDADRDKFLAALDNPPPPNAALKRALAAAAALRETAAG